MLGEPLSMLVPQVVGFRLHGRLPEGATATDLVLTVTEMLRRTGVVGKFVEYFGDGLAGLTVADRATLGNMSPEYGATCGFFPVDELTLDYLRADGPQRRSGSRSSRRTARRTCSGTTRREQPDLLGGRRARPGRRSSRRSPARAARRTACRSRGRRSRSSRRSAPSASTPDDDGAGSPRRSRRATRRPSRHPAGTPQPEPRRPCATPSVVGRSRFASTLDGEEVELDHGAVVIAAITSCTNTSNPQVMVGAGLLAKKAVERGLQRKPWVKSSLAPGSRVVTDYYERAGLQPYLDAARLQHGRLRLHDLHRQLRAAAGRDLERRSPSGDLVVCAVLSGNRNFEARIHPEVKANYLASPPLVVAYALAGRMDIDLANEPLGDDARRRATCTCATSGRARDEIEETIAAAVRGEMFAEHLRRRLHRRRGLAGLAVPDGRPATAGSRDSTYVRQPTVLRGHDRRQPGAVARHRRRALPRLARRLGDDRPHLAGRVDPARARRPDATWSSTASSARTSTRTAPGAATTR